LLSFIEEEPKVDAQFLILVEEDVLQFNLFEQAVTTAQVTHQLHQIYQKICDLELAQTLSSAHQRLDTPLVPFRNNKNPLSFIYNFQNRCDYLRVERSVQLEYAREMLSEGIDLQNRSGEVADVI